MVDRPPPGKAARRSTNPIALCPFVCGSVKHLWPARLHSSRPARPCAVGICQRALIDLVRTQAEHLEVACCSAISGRPGSAPLLIEQPSSRPGKSGRPRPHRWQKSSRAWWRAQVSWPAAARSRARQTNQLIAKLGNYTATTTTAAAAAAVETSLPESSKQAAGHERVGGETKTRKWRIPIELN